MDARWIDILIRRGRLTPMEETRLLKLPSAVLRRLQLLTIGRKYRQPRDLLRLPRNPAEEAVRIELAISTPDEVAAVKQVKAQLKRSSRTSKSYKEQQQKQKKKKKSK